MPLRKDIWRSAIACDPWSTIIERGSLEQSRIVWLPDAGPLRFLADPFGLWRDGKLYVFAEVYDYRTRVGSIDVLTYDGDLNLLEHGFALVEPWHLSYPLLLERDGETYMLPEAQRSGAPAFYRAIDFPHRWERALPLNLADVAIDATPVFHQDRWWIFYAPGTTEFAKQGELHVAWSPNLFGPWTAHPDNPIRVGTDGSRPAGQGASVDDHILLPVQDCSRTYGGAVKPLRIRISPTTVDLRLGEPIAPPSGTGGYDAGLHTLNPAGPVTLFDVKKIDVSPRGLMMEARREWRKLRARLASQNGA